MKFLKFLFEQVVFSNMLVSVAAACLTMETLMYVGAPADRSFAMAKFIFFSTLFTYNFQRLVRMKNISNWHNHRLFWIKKHRVGLIVLLIISLIGIVERLPFIAPEALVLLGLSGIVSFAYAVPVLSRNNEQLMLRDVPFVKIFLIALVWAMATVFVPYLDYVVEFDPDKFFYFELIQRFLFIFAITLPFDIRDMPYDKETGLKTFPLLMGEKNTKNLAISILILAFGIELLGYFSGSPESIYHLLAITLSYLATATVIQFAKATRPELYFSGLLESMMILRFLLIWLVCFVA